MSTSDSESTQGLEAGARARMAGPAFPSLDDLLSRLRRLAQAHPDQLALSVYGTSRAGEPLYALQIGEGPRRILAYGFPQPDEPVGGLVVLRLAERLLHDSVLCQRGRWTLLPCVDPDGARRNEKWFADAPDLACYARRHFRPPEGEQVEWSFPSLDPSWPWDTPLPETTALQVLIDAVRPQVLFPLHNALLGGAYAFVSVEGEPLASRLSAVWEGHSLPTHLGAAELPFAKALGPGVFRLPDTEEIAAALSSQGIEGPAGLLACGVPAYLYARRSGPVVTVVLELPLFTVPGIADDRPTDHSYRQVLRAALAADEAALELWSGLYGQAAPFLKAGNPYASALDAHRRQAPAFLKATAEWLSTDPALSRPATAAELLDAQELAGYWRLLPLGLLEQALTAERDALQAPSARLRERVSRHLGEGLAEVLPALEATPVEPAVLVDVLEEVILRAVLA